MDQFWMFKELGRPVFYDYITKTTRTMFAKVKSSIFIDVLTLELVAPIRSSLKAILRDEKGEECQPYGGQCSTR